MDAVLEQLRIEGYALKPEDVARLSPLIFDHINFLGRYAFALPDSVAHGQLRPLRRVKLSKNQPEKKQARWLSACHAVESLTRAFQTGG